MLPRYIQDPWATPEKLHFLHIAEKIGEGIFNNMQSSSICSCIMISSGIGAVVFLHDLSRMVIGRSLMHSAVQCACIEQQDLNRFPIAKELGVPDEKHEDQKVVLSCHCDVRKSSVVAGKSCHASSKVKPKSSGSDPLAIANELVVSV